MRPGTLLVGVATLMAALPSCKNADQVKRNQPADASNTNQASQVQVNSQSKFDWNQDESAKRYTLVLDDVTYDPNDTVRGHFSFTHHYPVAVKLFGFGFSGPGQFQVQFESFRRQEGGQWADVPVGYCGTGARTYELQPDTKYVLLVSLWPFFEKGTKGQVGVPGEGAMLVSTPFDTDRIQRAWKSYRQEKEVAPNSGQPLSPPSPDQPGG
jgi:hypothetical protein